MSLLIQTDLITNFHNWKFNNVFSRKGIQAICGTLTNENFPECVVYKVNAHPDRSIEHEDFIFNKTNELHSHSNHFTYKYHSKLMDIPNKFVESNSKDSCNCENCKDNCNLLSSSKNSKNKLVLFMEYIGNINLKHIIRANDDLLTTCQLIMCMAALTQGIEHCGFCHYDLHIDNIIHKECDPYSYYAYKFLDGKTVLTPTRGYYPVFIDYGTSHVNDYPTEKNNCKTSIINADRGLQSTLFDNLIDVHQLIISSLYELEEINDKYSSLSNHILRNFKHIPIYRESGWKKLSISIFDKLLDIIFDYDESIETDYPIMVRHQSLLIETLNLAIKLPFKQYSTEQVTDICNKYKIKSNECIGFLFKEICKEVTNIQNSLNLLNSSECNINEIYYILIDIIENQNTTNIKTKYNMGKKCNIAKLLTNINELSIFLSCLYYESFTINEKTIKECYSKNPIKNALDMVNYLQTNIPIRPLHTGIVDVYCFDSLSKSMTIKKLDTSTYKPGKKWIREQCSILFD